MNILTLKDLQLGGNPNIRNFKQKMHLDQAHPESKIAPVPMFGFDRTRRGSAIVLNYLTEVLVIPSVLALSSIVDCVIQILRRVKG